MRSKQMKAPVSEVVHQPMRGTRSAYAGSSRMVAQRKRFEGLFGTSARAAEPKTHPGGMPVELNAGIAQLSGQDLSDVSVHRNSAEPESLGAQAFARGNEIHLGPGAERHLNHEAWHVVQQREGRVDQTGTVQRVAINDDPELEAEADRMGDAAAQTSGADVVQPRMRSNRPPVTQMKRSAEREKLMNDELAKVFKSGNWIEFYGAQEAFQTTFEKDLKETDDTGPQRVEVTAPPSPEEGVGKRTEPTPQLEGGNFTTYGVEFELMDYKDDSPLANTAHVELAKGKDLPLIKGVHNELVTDSMNVVEYVSPVLVMPVDWSKGAGDVADNLTYTKGLLKDWGTQIVTHYEKAANPTVQALVDDPNMAFAGFAVVKNISISFREIDEETNPKKLLTLLDAEAPFDVGTLPLGRTAKQDIKWDFADVTDDDYYTPEQALNEAIQATIQIPLRYAAQLSRMSMDTKKDTSSGRSAYDKVKGHLPDKHLTPDQANLMHMMVHRLLINLQTPDAVTFQAQYQYDRLSKAALEASTAMARALAALKVGEEYQTAGMRRMPKIEGLPEKYAAQAKHFDNVGYDKVGQEHFTKSHSFVKDHLDVWSRTYLDDMYGNLLGGIDPKDREALVKELAGIVQSVSKPAGEWLFARGAGLIETLGDASNALFKTNRPSRGFLDDDPNLPDLRQDTLRPIQHHARGGAMTLVEMRDVKPETLSSLKDIKEPKK